MSVVAHVLSAVLALAAGIACMLLADATGKGKAIDDVWFVCLGILELVIGGASMLVLTGTQDATPMIMAGTVLTAVGTLTFGCVWFRFRKTLSDAEELLVQVSLFTNVTCTALVLDHQYPALLWRLIGGIGFMLAICRILFGFAVLGINHLLAQEDTAEHEDPPS